MGSKSGKDAEDRALDEVEFKEVGIQDFDGVFEKAGEPINKVATLNNSILDAQEAIFNAVLATAGLYYVAKLDGSSPVKIVVEEVTETTTKGLSEAEITALPDLAGPYKTIMAELTKFNDLVTASEGAEVSVVNNRVVVKSAKDKATKAKLANAAKGVNNSLFGLKKGTRKALGKDSMNFKDILMEAVKVFKEAKQMPKIVPNLEKLAEGEIAFDTTFGGAAGKIQKLWDAIAGEGGLIESVKSGVSATIDLKGDIEALKEEIEGLPKDFAAIKDKATEAGLGPMAAMKAAKSLAGNAKLFTTTAKYMPVFLETVKALAADLKESFKE